MGGGNFKTKEQLKSEDRRKFRPQSENQEKLSAVLEGIANKRGTILTSIALAYVMHKTPYVFPICGCRKVSYLKANIEALSLKLTDEEIDEIENAVPFDLGFPASFARVAKSPRIVEELVQEMSSSTPCMAGSNSFSLSNPSH